MFQHEGKENKGRVISTAVILILFLEIDRTVDGILFIVQMFKAVTFPYLFGKKQNPNKFMAFSHDVGQSKYYFTTYSRYLFNIGVRWTFFTSGV